LRAAAATLVVAGVAAGLVGTAVLAGKGDGETRPRPAASGSTLEATLTDPDGNGALQRRSGEPLRDRTELAPASRRGRSLALMAQISDAHVRDEESPARALLLDRLGSPFTSTFRPHEALSGQVLAAAVGSLNRLAPDAVLVTGDLADSAQANELGNSLAVLEGGEVDPDSGDDGYDGPQSASNPDPFIYRPEVDAPRHPGLLDRAQQRFRSPGLDAPWYPALGNHDVLVQGEAPPSARLEQLAVGDRALVEADTDLRLPDSFDASAVDEVLGGGLPGRTAPVPADPARGHLAAGEVVARLRAAGDGGGSGARLDYSFDVGPSLRAIVLDVVRREGGSDGRVSGGQVRWLGREIARAGPRWLIVVTHQPLRSSLGGRRALALLDSSPRVVAAVSGHTHESSLEPRRTDAGGYWLIGTPSLADFPQQTRALRLVQTTGGLALETWMMDTAPGGLADTARELAFLDAQGGRPQGAAGGVADRNARLYLSR